MTHPAFIFIPLISPFTFSFYLWFILTVENTAHFLVAQIKLKHFFFILTILLLDTYKVEVKIRSLVRAMCIPQPPSGKPGFHPKGLHSDVSCLSSLKTSRCQKIKSFFLFNSFLREMQITPIFSQCGVLPIWLIQHWLLQLCRLHIAGKQKNIPSLHQITDSQPFLLPTNTSALACQHRYQFL